MVQPIGRPTDFEDRLEVHFFSFSWQSLEFGLISPISVWWVFLNFFSEALKNTGLGFVRNRSDYLNEKNPVAWNGINDPYVNSNRKIC